MSNPINVTGLSKIAQSNITEPTKESKGQSSAESGQALPPKAPQEDALAVGDGNDTISLEQAVEHINSYIQNIQRDIQFTMDDFSGRTVIKVVDSQTDTVIRQIPSETILKLAENLHKYGQLLKLEV